MYSLIEINKQNLERLEKSLATLPVIKDLEETDEYINMYLPFKIQNMIDETLFATLGSMELQKLIPYEQ